MLESVTESCDCLRDCYQGLGGITRLLVIYPVHIVLTGLVDLVATSNVPKIEAYLSERTTLWWQIT